uniref:Uncharacterized protein n=1 Tax=Zea mays TaxID=4577 RepID=B6UBD7_MAIZE|nr:hypothetical protein [Zea mays]
MIDTLSFVDALPSLRSRQWQAVVLVMLDALSVHQLPALAPVSGLFKSKARAKGE